MKKFLIKIIILSIIFFVGYFIGNGQIFKENNLSKKEEQKTVISKSVCDEMMKTWKLNPIEIYEGKPTKVDFSTYPEAKMFRTTITEQALKGPNFAGHYTFATWGCGTSCLMYAIIDSISGKVVLMNGPYEEEQLTPHFDINSRLLVLNSKDDFEQSKGQNINEILGENNRGFDGLSRIYYELMDGKEWERVWLNKICGESALDGIFSY